MLLNTPPDQKYIIGKEQGHFVYVSPRDRLISVIRLLCGYR